MTDEWVITFADGRQVVKRDKDLGDYLRYECDNPIYLSKLERRERK